MKAQVGASIEVADMVENVNKMVVTEMEIVEILNNM